MKTMPCLLVGLIGLLGCPAHAQRSGTGVGVIVGEPTGVSLKHWVAPGRAFDAAAAWSFAGGDSFQLHSDYLFHRLDALEPEFRDSMALYYGLGVRLRFDEERGGRDHDDEETTLGIRVPLGIDNYQSESHLGFFVELVPVLEVAPSTELSLTVALGVRYFFP